MYGAFIILIVTVVAGVILYLTHRLSSNGYAEDALSAPADAADADEQCCGRHAVCEKGLSPSGDPVYYDDEELDRFAGREPESYDEEEIEEFRKVLYTLIPEDVYAWGASLTVRGVALPYSLRDEWLMLCENDK